MTFAAFAREQGVDEKAVRKAAASGRLSAAVLGKSATGRRVVISDPAAARREWVENAGQARLEVPAPAAAVALEAPAADSLEARLAAVRAQRAAAAAVAAPAGEAPRGGAKVGTLMEAQRRVTLERGRKLKMENDRRSGELIEVAVAAREAFEASRIIREAVLNLPARVAAELAGLTDAGAVYLRLDEELRAILLSTAEALSSSRDVEPDQGKEGSGG